MTVNTYAEMAELIYSNSPYSRVTVAEQLEARTMRIMESRKIGFAQAEKVLIGEFEERTGGLIKALIKEYIIELTIENHRNKLNQE